MPLVASKQSACRLKLGHPNNWRPERPLALCLLHNKEAKEPAERLFVRPELEKDDLTQSSICKSFNLPHWREGNNFVTSGLATLYADLECRKLQLRGWQIYRRFHHLHWRNLPRVNPSSWQPWMQDYSWIQAALTLSAAPLFA